MLKILIGIFVSTVLLSPSESASLEERLQIAKRILRDTPLVDGHNDLPFNALKFADNQLERFNLEDDLRNVKPWSESPYSHTDIPRLKQGMVGAQFWSAYLKCRYPNQVQNGLGQIDVIKRMVEKYNHYMEFVTTSDGIEDSFRKGKLGSLIGLEGGQMINNSLATLRSVYDLGVRYMTLTHTCELAWACSSVTEDEGREDRGLTSFGEDVVKEMNRLGMLVDISHVSAQTMRDAIRVTRAPVIFSHSATRALCPHTRNVPDDVLEKLKGNGGILMLTFFATHINCETNATLQDVVQHINHIRNVAGIDHVGIGADYDGVSKLPIGLEDVTKYPYLLAELLLDTNWSEADIKKLVGQNFLRVFRKVEDVSRQMKASGMKPIERLFDGPFKTSDSYHGEANIILAISMLLFGQWALRTD